MSILEVKNIYYEKDNTKILNDISFNVEKGDCISIIGSSGSGKSTLLKLCSDLIPVTKGNLFYKEKDYNEYNPIELRKNISYCIQIPHLFGDNVYENLTFPYKIRNTVIDRYRIVEMLNKFNLDESILKKDIKSLSGGEKQRISIIRNLIYTPDILLLDEATSALDKENARLVETYIRNLNLNGVTILWITHSLEQSTKIFNKRILMCEGKIEDIERIK